MILVVYLGHGIFHPVKAISICLHPSQFVGGDLKLPKFEETSEEQMGHLSIVERVACNCLRSHAPGEVFSELLMLGKLRNFFESAAPLYRGVAQR